jgi:hypothetical protein
MTVVHREHIEWCDIWVESAGDSPLPRALLVGDSITRSYYPHACTNLAEHFACARIASSKCVTDPMYLKELELVLGQYEFSVVHFNNGLHGWDYDEEAYATGLAKAFDYLGDRLETGRLIWGSTTPLWSKDDPRALDPRTTRVRTRNSIAEALAADRQIQINDLFAEVVDYPEVFAPDGVHLLEDGQKKLGACVSRAILP